MWDLQQPFRRGLEAVTRAALQRIGAGVGPRAYLVGLRTTDQAETPWRVEPATEPVTGVDLGGVEDRAEQLYRADPDSGGFHVDPGVHENFQRRLRDRAMARALSEALGRSAAGAGRRFFVGRPGPVGGYGVYPVISVVTSRWEALPSLVTADPMVRSSLQRAVVTAALESATSDLYGRVPPGMPSAEHERLVQSATEDLVGSVGWLAGRVVPHGLLPALNAVAAQPYEGRSGAGTIVLGRRDSGVDVDVVFTSPIDMSSTRAFRKALEMSGPGLHLLSDGGFVYGLGRTSPGYDPSDESVFTVTVAGRGSWSLIHDTMPMLQVDDTLGRLPAARLAADEFADTAHRLFDEASGDDVEALWRLADASSAQAHGTMLVVHRDAAGEAQRLGPQALAITPTALDDATLRAVTNIDGAVLVSPDARCHAVGVILDGRATGEGDPARGARYNSAVRYLAAAGEDCLIIIVSEDGSIDLLPRLMPRVHAARVEAAVAALEDAAREPIDLEEFHRRDEVVGTVEFYLDPGQCDRVNAARDERRAFDESQGNWIVVHLSRVAPNPRMDETYFLKG